MMKSFPQRSPASRVGRDWEYLAELGSVLVGMAEESEIVAAALDQALVFLNCESARLVLAMQPLEPGVVGSADAAGRISGRTTRPPTWNRLRRSATGAGRPVPAPDAVGTLHLVPRGSPAPHVLGGIGVRPA